MRGVESIHLMKTKMKMNRNLLGLRHKNNHNSHSLRIFADSVLGRGRKTAKNARFADLILSQSGRKSAATLRVLAPIFEILFFVTKQKEGPHRCASKSRIKC